MSEQESLLGPGQQSGEADYTRLRDNVDANSNGSTERAEGESPEPKSYLTSVVPMAVGIFLCAMDQTIIVSCYASIGSELNQLQNTSWVATAYLLTIASFQPLYGKLSDIFGRKQCLLFSYSIFAIGCLFCGISRSMTELVASRAFAGIGGGGMQTLVSIIVSDLIPLRSRGTWQGLLGLVWATGNAVGASLGGYLADTIGWRWAFLIQVPIALIAIVSVSLALHLPKIESSDFAAKIKRVDFGGAISLVFTIFFLLFALDRGGNVSWDDKLTLSSLGAFSISLVAFAFIEMEFAAEPFAPKRIVVNRSLIASYLVNFFGVAPVFVLLFHISLYFQAVQGASASAVSMWLVLGVGGMVSGSLGGGFIIQVTGKYYRLTLIAYGALLVGTLLVTLSSGIVTTSTVGIVTGLVLSNLGFGCGSTTSLISLIANAGQADQAIATAISHLFRSLGSVVGLSIGSTLVQYSLRAALYRRLSGADIDELINKVRESLDYLKQLDPNTRAAVIASYEDAFHVTFWFSVVMAVCALLSSIFIKETPMPRRGG